MVERLVVVGGDAAGMSAASRARRLRGPGELEIVAFERGRYSSYSACGVPYWVGGDVDGPQGLVARSPEEHRKRGIDLRMGTEVTTIDLDRGRVLARDLAEGTERWTGFDKLVVATGAVPVRPPLPGIDAAGVHGVQTLEDGQRLLDTLSRTEGDRAVVVGSGYIGVEMAEALVKRGYRVTLVDQAEQPMSTLDPDMGELVRTAMEDMGITTAMGRRVTEIRTDASGRATAVCTQEEEYPADVVVLGMGVRPGTALAEAAGLPLGEYGGILTDQSMRVRGQEAVWAGGDCVEVLDLVSLRHRHIPLGTHANKHGQVIGANVAGGYATFPGVVGTAVSKVCDLEIARTGLLEREAAEAGLRVVTATVESTSRAGYFPGSSPMHVKLLAEHRTGRLLGAQIVGREGAGKRVDIAAVALTAGMTVEGMTSLDLGYAPPFSPVWDPVLVAARKAAAAVAAAVG
ncbi:FAD-dependent oxidoreductase [Streptomyces sp. NPDC059740]|uniref:FAD-dependent oxidoreductase n=1 Tax=Streptomyces sp. NPDC059740 TaxID=3346926 RepID=UPI0036650B89